ncbi:MAG: MtrAB system histidine kinase MtrB [Corynebacterium sp.]|nr:MtrAB system histidine kinase MtrB [Corynebacterium sp.]
MVRRQLGLWRSRLQAANTRAIEKWRTSLQVRVIGTLMATSVTVVLIIGLVMISIMAQRLMQGKLDVADGEIERARVTVEQQISSTDTSNTVQSRLNSARSALTARTTSGQSDNVAQFEPLLVQGGGDSPMVTSPENAQVPLQLQSFVLQNQVSYQYVTLERQDGSRYKALVIGTPCESDIKDLQLYLIFPLDSEESTMTLLRYLFAFGGLVLMLLIIGIAWFLTQQVTGPVRSASRIAQRFAAGHLRERMSVNGEDEMARLAMSFNTMAESISKQINQLEEYGNLQRQFTSDVSHELRTPLTTVRMAADLIADQKEDLEPATARATELMIRELDRFEELLADLLEISRHDAGMADLSRERVDLRKVIQTSWKSVSQLATNLNVPMYFSLPAEPVMVEVDTRRIERILRNLLANAFDHSEGNPVLLTLAATSSAAAITVADQGVGLRPGQEELVFNRFWRADPSRKRHSGGTGLGLAIAHEDAILHGGTLDAIGTPGVGSVFRLTIPRSPNGDYEESPLPLEAPQHRVDYDQPENTSHLSTNPHEHEESEPQEGESND